MTGKEALKEWIDHYRIDCHKYCGDSFLEKLKVIEKDLDKLDKVEEKLTKYERAFEILKDSGIIKIGNNPFNNTYYLQRNDTNGNIVVIKLTKEEYELIEELMNNE